MTNSYNASAKIDFGARTIDLKVENVSYFFNGGPGRLFVFNDDAGGGGTAGTFDNDTGAVADTWTDSANAANFPTAPTDGASATVSAAILNNTDTGLVAAAGRVNVRITENGGTTVIEGGRTVNRQ